MLMTKLGVIGALQKERRLFFGGVDNLVTIDSAASVISGGSWTISAWLNITADYSCFLGGGTNFANKGLHLIYNSDLAFRFGFYANDADFIPPQKNTGWHYYIFQYNETTGTKNAWVDGSQVITDVASAGIDVSGLLHLGASMGGYSSPYSGGISDVRLHNRALSLAEVLSLYQGIPVPSGLVSQWLLNEGKGLVAIDSVGSNNGIVSGAKWNTTSQDGIPYKTITVDSTKIDTALTNYPVMVKLTTGNFDFSRVRTDGMDIAFYDMSDNPLSFEREYFLTNSQAVFHVRIPSISTTVNTAFKMVYGNGLATDFSNKNAVWDANFVMVQHMGTSLVDSTGNANDGTATGTTVVDGINGKARNFNGTSDGVQLPNTLMNPNVDYTFSTIIKRESIVAVNDILLYASYGPVNQYSHFPTFGDGLADADLSIRASTGTWANFGRILAIPLAQYKSVCFSRGSSISTGYGDGVKGTAYPIGTVTFGATPAGFACLGSAGTARFYNGVIDEVRISNIARSDAWIKADDYNLRLNTLVSIV